MEFRDHKSHGADSDATFLPDVVPAFKIHERTKRMLDIFAAAMGIILFAPILLIICIAIRLDSRGPIFVRDIKYGYKDRKIQILKFRLVAACTASDPINPRLTRVGRIVSQTGIDELPQLFNVLRGEMSIVGRQNILRWRPSLH